MSYANPPPPPPPARRYRQPFVTICVGDVFPFLTAKDLSVCMCVCRAWKEEANSLHLWRGLLANDSNTAKLAYCGLKVDDIRGILLRSSSLKKKGIEEAQVVVQNGLANFCCTLNEISSGLSVGMHFRNDVPVQRFSSGVPFAQKVFDRRGCSGTSAEPTFSELNAAISSMFTAIEILNGEAVLLKKQITDAAHVLSSLYECMPSNNAIWLHQECIKQWNRLKMFEEFIILLINASLDEPSCRLPFRSFVHAEIASLQKIDCSFLSQWSRFKRVFPLDDHYYDYADWLFLFGPGRRLSLRFSFSDEELGKQQMERFSILSVLIENVVKQRNKNVGKKTWEELLFYLESKKDFVQ